MVEDVSRKEAMRVWLRRDGPCFLREMRGVYASYLCLFFCFLQSFYGGFQGVGVGMVDGKVIERDWAIISFFALFVLRRGVP